MESMKEINPTILKTFGVISKEKAWTVELNLVKWGNYKEKFDLRKFDRSSDIVGKGITLSVEQLLNLKNLLNTLDIEEIAKEFQL